MIFKKDKNEKEIKIEKFIKSLNLNKWFVNISKITITQSANIKYINSLRNAVLIWESRIKSRQYDIEKLKTKNKINNDELEQIFNMTLNELKNNQSYLAFIKNTNFENNTFIELLPIIPTYIEESATFSTNNYFKSEINIYKKGHFICEHDNTQFLIY